LAPEVLGSNPSCGDKPNFLFFIIFSAAPCVTDPDASGAAIPDHPDASGAAIPDHPDASGAPIASVHSIAASLQDTYGNGVSGVDRQFERGEETVSRIYKRGQEVVIQKRFNGKRWNAICREAGCDNIAMIKGFCRGHMRALKKPRNEPFPTIGEVAHPSIRIRDPDASGAAIADHPDANGAPIASVHSIAASLQDGVRVVGRQYEKGDKKGEEVVIQKRRRFNGRRWQLLCSVDGCDIYCNHSGFCGRHLRALRKQRNKPFPYSIGDLLK
jgi:hypothetical protein